MQQITQIAEEIAILKKEKILIEIEKGVCYYAINRNGARAKREYRRFGYER